MYGTYMYTHLDVSRKKSKCIPPTLNSCQNRLRTYTQAHRNGHMPHTQTHSTVNITTHNIMMHSDARNYSNAYMFAYLMKQIGTGFFIDFSDLAFPIFNISCSYLLFRRLAGSTTHLRFLSLRIYYVLSPFLFLIHVEIKICGNNVPFLVTKWPGSHGNPKSGFLHSEGFLFFSISGFSV